ncbi:hypothetical protein E3J68_03870 [Candidatus Aerophobetes bacterium]|uniref:DUF4097 domain-containing protein n=1 Tax=Aerophobetes bacterium TaxID=2030807 RepID=A0A523TCL8_UNCAE|nr:MAG: hypothetical protein E3J68_03870 [Candidatus Aerophobetes bacterium]
MMKKTILAGTFILLAALVTSSSSAQKQEEIVSRYFWLKEEGLVSLNNPRGDISIQSWGKNHIEVIATKLVEGSNEKRMKKALEKIKVEFVATEDNLHIKTDLGESRFKTFFLFDKVWNFFSTTQRRVDYQLWVPPRVNVLAETTSGNFFIKGIRGDVKTKGVSGRTEFSSIQGKVEAETISGEIKLMEVEGDVNLSSLSGDLSLDQVKGNIFATSTSGKLQMSSVEGIIRGYTTSGKIVMRKIRGVVELIETASGDIQAELLEVADDWLGMIFDSVSGDIEVSLPRNLRANLGIKTVSGRISCDFTILTRGEFEAGALGGPINGGGPFLEIETTSGDIFLRQI